MAARLLVVAAVANAVFAYSNTSPIVAWSSSSSYALDSLPSRLHSVSLLETIFGGEDVCDHDAVVIIQQPGLHASDLRSLHPRTHLARTLASSPSARQYPYVPAHPELDVLSIAKDVSSKCRSTSVHYAPGNRGVALKEGAKHVVCLTMPHLEESGKARKEAMAEHESLLGIELSTLASIFPNHLVVYTGSSSHFQKRQADDTPDRPILDFDGLDEPTVVSVYANTTLPEGGILKRYQLLTPTLILSLLLSFFVLLPVLWFGLTALASIQNPVRSDVSRSFNAQEKKNQ